MVDFALKYIVCLLVNCICKHTLITHIRTHLHTHTKHMYVHMHTFMHVHMHTCTHVHTCTLHTFVVLYMYACTTYAVNASILLLFVLFTEYLSDLLLLYSFFFFLNDNFTLKPVLIHSARGMFKPFAQCT